MTGPLGNSELCFPRISMFPETKSRETLRFSGNKIHCSPRDQSLSVYYQPNCLVIIHTDAAPQFLQKLTPFIPFYNGHFGNRRNWPLYGIDQQTKLTFHQQRKTQKPRSKGQGNSVHSSRKHGIGSLALRAQKRENIFLVLSLALMYVIKIFIQDISICSFKCSKSLNNHVRSVVMIVSQSCVCITKSFPNDK